MRSGSLSKNVVLWQYSPSGRGVPTEGRMREDGPERMSGRGEKKKDTVTR
jgi:hypothetical protein